MATKVKERRFAVASNFSRGEQWLDQILILRPLHTDTLTTSIGTNEATITHVIEVLESGEAIDHGEQSIFWTVVRGQLAKATDDIPWIAGRLIRVGNAFRLESLTPSEEDQVDKVLAGLDL
jgi:hypothetical protein